MTDAPALPRLPLRRVLWAVRWYLQFPISYRDLERMLVDRGVEVDHTTMYRWVQRFAPELEKRLRRRLRPLPRAVARTRPTSGSGVSGATSTAVDGTRQTIDFLLSAKQDKRAASASSARRSPARTPAIRGPSSPTGSRATPARSGR